MDIDLNGYKAHRGDMPMGDLIIHNGHRMTESETRMAVNWGIAHGYKSASELPDEVIDKICDPFCKIIPSMTILRDSCRWRSYAGRSVEYRTAIMSIGMPMTLWIKSKRNYDPD